ncbi:hypothetical protein V1509DRAFT_634518 [Lipomyces kononenkoae]
MASSVLLWWWCRPFSRSGRVEFETLEEKTKTHKNSKATAGRIRFRPGGKMHSRTRLMDHLQIRRHLTCSQCEQVKETNPGH